MIRTERLCRRFHVGDTWVHALDEVDLHIEEGDFVAVMGPSGSGKSTLMNIIGCLDVPSSGQYLLDGHDVSRLGEDELAAIALEQHAAWLAHARGEEPPASTTRNRRPTRNVRARTTASSAPLQTASVAPAPTSIPALGQIGAGVNAKVIVLLRLQPMPATSEAGRRIRTPAGRSACLSPT